MGNRFNQQSQSVKRPKVCKSPPRPPASIPTSQCITKYPTVISQASSPGATIAWLNLANILTPGDDAGTSQPTSASDGQKVTADHFGFALPSNATIYDMYVEYRGKSNALDKNELYDEFLLDAGIVGPFGYQPAPKDFEFDTTFQTVKFQVPSPPTGTWTPAKVNLTNFGVRFSSRRTLGNGTLSIAFVRVTICYTTP